MILGVTGHLASGKDTVGALLRDKGFHHISLSDFIREEAKKRRIKDTRANLINLGNEMRTTQGHGILARLALQRMEWDKNYVVTSIRNPTELEILRTKQGFAMLNISAPQHVRWKRMEARRDAEARGDDLDTIEEFKMREEQEAESTDPAKQQVNYIIKMSDITLDNSGTVEQLNKKLDKLIKQWQHKLDDVRPSWDEYFLHLALEVGKRATCDRGKSGSVIVRDKRLISTGYVGAPVGLPHCDEVGHLMHEVINIDGTKSKHCIRTTHAETNAIAQAARHGVAVAGATLYCKMEPCLKCAQLIINAQIKRVVCLKRYHRAQLTRDMFKQAKVKLDVIQDEFERYGKQ